MNASRLMTRQPVTVAPSATLAEVWDAMRDLEIRHVPVVQGGALVGIVSDRDLARADILTVLAAQGAEALRLELATPVARVMSSDVLSIDTETELADAVEIFIEQKVGALPVVRPDTGELVGILSYIDVLRGLQEKLAELG